MHYLQALPTLLAIILLTFLGFLVIHNQHKRTNFLFVGFIFADTIWLLGVFLVNFTAYDSNVYLSRIIFAASVGLAAGVLSFTNSLLHLYRHRKLMIGIYGWGWVLLTLTAATNLIIKGVRINNAVHQLSVFPVYGPLYILFILYIVGIVTLLLVPMARHSSKAILDRVTKKQFNLVRIGLTAFVILSLLTNLILPNVLAKSWPSVFAPAGSVVLAIAFFYAMTRYRLFDVRFVAVRAGAYLTTVFVFTLLFIAPFVFVVEKLIGGSLSLNQFILVVSISAVLLFFLQFLRLFFDRLTAAIFFRHYYNPQEVLDRLSDIIARTANTETLRNDTLDLLRDVLRPNTIAYNLFADKSEHIASLARQIEMKASGSRVVDVEDLESNDRHLTALLKDNDIALAIKLRTTHENLGYMVLGYKKSGELYTDRDRRLLSVAADEIAVSLQNALRFEEIQNFNATLQRNVDKATGQLRNSNRRLRELDTAKDDFISMASHQLRTPLTSIKGYLSMVLEGDAGELNDRQHAMLQQAFNSSQQMVYLISDLLNLSRLSTGKFIIEPSPVDLSEVVQAEVSQLREIAKGRGLTLTYSRPHDFPALLLDETKIHQVVMNFIDNALHYTTEGGAVIVALEETATAVEYTVTDTGIGVPKSVQHRLFSKFYRADNAQKVRPDGTGLGLFMAKKVVTAQGGVIIFHSTEGQGSTFGFRIPKVGHLATKA